MSTPKHTPEPWYIGTHGVHEVQDARGNMIADFGNIGTARADRDRAVQCVNACAGMDDPAAEVARLREIERVARELIADSYTAIGPSHPTRAPYDVAAPGRTWNALREALTPKEP